MLLCVNHLILTTYCVLCRAMTEFVKARLRKIAYVLDRRVLVYEQVRNKNIEFYPVKAVWKYWQVRKHTNINTALFPFMDGSSISRQFFSNQLKSSLTWANLVSHKYNSHSFHTGAATTSAIRE